MTTFALFSVLMVLAAIVLVVWPLLSRAEAKEKPVNNIGALIVVGLVPLFALGLYSQNTTWDWGGGSTQAVPPSSNGELPSVAEMVNGLQERLAREPDDLSGWRMLGRSYVTLNRFPEAVEAYRRAYELTNGRDADVVADYAEAMALVDPPSLTEGEAGSFFEQVLALSPNNPKALFYGGMRAYGNGDWATARDRWSRLRAMSPPEAVVRMLDERLAEIGAKEGRPAQARAGGQAAAPVLSSSIRLSLSVAPELAGRIIDSTPLFIFARQSGGAGPPVAVIRRRAGDLPMTVELSDSDAMLPGTRLSSFESLRLVARVSFGGTPQAQSGDLFGEHQYRADQEGDVRLVIDQVVP